VGALPHQPSGESQAYVGERRPLLEWEDTKSVAPD
jgi:hypothetical protein